MNAWKSAQMFTLFTAACGPASAGGWGEGACGHGYPLQRFVPQGRGWLENHPPSSFHSVFRPTNGEYYPHSSPKRRAKPFELAEEFQRKSELDLMTGVYNQESFRRYTWEALLSGQAGDALRL